jgi:hypothetical protein
MLGLKPCATASAVPLGLNATPFPSLVGSVAGLAYFVPKPVAFDHGYAAIYGLLPCPTAIAAPSGLNATPNPIAVGGVAGSAYFVPKPVAFDHGYAVMYGEV